MDGRYRYVIIGGGLAGASAIKGIRERDMDGRVMLLGAEADRPYDRPPLSKKLWFGQKKLEDIFLEPTDYYEKNGVDLRLGTRAVKLDANEKTVIDDTGGVYGYEKLLIATGGSPRALQIPGGDLEEIFYYRYIDDYRRLRQKAAAGASALVIGGGFIGSEIAAALSFNGVEVTMIFPSSYICDRVFPEPLGRAVEASFIKKGIRLFPDARPASVAKKGDRFILKTVDGRSFESDMVIAGIGITPAVELARSAGIKTEDGITVDEFLRTSEQDVFAAGDCAFFPYKALDRMTRVEHWDNALTQGRRAGLNMAGAKEPYDHMPYFFSDLFDFGYEAVGEVSSNLDTFADWQEENMKGVVYYLKERRVRGVMLCNVWEKVDEARSLIRKGGELTPEDLLGAISLS
ncbi:MAG TPA: pyridine nucleotide-disulfide oxidoreductase [Deltaproteobacteria bacterium]|nr:MAG: hypothetical protein A2Z79_00715 [Deltaproteobacteria bacterium GWA2_55_82]OGQ64898.1 MAG: hypothetical protein A3I81_04825 [Deltaproteobacteria bacterium RIFCSPLOWO2_02_FULL_55_12]OIJ73966.1 MAG: hypothetical protein A2V21_306620 [Deltaproteobacteria bacterium GWC2_55_46]HBG46565.1 pyridine nucleotide-disulfide oxidoreductase [Deltaproteobacteria bacterium]HCY09967.1 pyridine nucleotide-disulfide oxidoreductase [Deltaproteobacteria bacterium]